MKITLNTTAPPNRIAEITGKTNIERINRITKLARADILMALNKLNLSLSSLIFVK
jgi:hypothetical protein